MATGTSSGIVMLKGTESPFWQPIDKTRTAPIVVADIFPAISQFLRAKRPIIVAPQSICLAPMPSRHCCDLPRPIRSRLRKGRVPCPQLWAGMGCSFGLHVIHRRWPFPLSDRQGAGSPFGHVNLPAQSCGHPAHQSVSWAAAEVNRRKGGGATGPVGFVQSVRGAARRTARLHQKNEGHPSRGGPC
jgi:hypothetical protein